jgi:hypothetical protein
MSFDVNDELWTLPNRTGHVYGASHLLNDLFWDRKMQSICQRVLIRFTDLLKIDEKCFAVIMRHTLPRALDGDLKVEILKGVVFILT